MPKGLIRIRNDFHEDPGFMSQARDFFFSMEAVYRTEHWAVYEVEHPTISDYGWYCCIVSKEAHSYVITFRLEYDSLGNMNNDALKEMVNDFKRQKEQG